MKFGVEIQSEAIPEWRQKYICYKALKKKISYCSTIADNSIEQTLPETVLIVEPQTAASENSPLTAFFSLLSSEVAKVEQFCEQNIAEARRKANQIARNVEASRKDAAIANSSKSLIQEAILESYRHLELLKQFLSLNQKAVYKILKKFDKKTERDSSWYAKRLKEAQFYTSIDEIKDIMSELENLLVEFNETPRKVAMKKLRLPSRKPKVFTYYVFGLLAGLSVHPLITVATRVNSFSEKHDAGLTMLRIYGGVAIPTLFFYVLAMVALVWRKYRVNYVFILGLDPRDHIRPGQFGMMGSLLLVIFAYTSFVHIVMQVPLATEFPTLFFSTFLATFLIALLCPFNVFFRDARVWFLKSLGRILASGLLPVEFRDFFLCDLLCSLTYSFLSLQLFSCSVVHNFHNVESSCRLDSWIVPIPLSLPSFWRLCQCLRRYRDTRQALPHLANALKYTLALSVIWISPLGRSSVEGGQIIWAVFAFCSACFSNFWDICIDWGVLEGGCRLRKTLMYPRLWYIPAILLNTILRFSWVFLISPRQWLKLPDDSQSLVFVLAVLEMLRRSVWCLFRMENEMVNNIGQFRAVKEVPLPLDDDDDE